MAVGEPLALAGLDPVVADARLLGMEIVGREARLLEIAEAELGGGALDVGELLQCVPGGHLSPLTHTTPSPAARSWHPPRPRRRSPGWCPSTVARGRAPRPARRAG